jgi:hypothetical protein
VNGDVIDDDNFVMIGYKCGGGEFGRKFRGIETGVGVDDSAIAFLDEQKTAARAANIAGDADNVFQGRVQWRTQKFLRRRRMEPGPFLRLGGKRHD